MKEENLIPMYMHVATISLCTHSKNSLRQMRPPPPPPPPHDLDSLRRLCMPVCRVLSQNNVKNVFFFPTKTYFCREMVNSKLEKCKRDSEIPEKDV